MHGRKRVGVPPPTPEVVAATAKKVEQYKKLSSIVLHHRAGHTTSPQSLELAGQLLAANPDVYTLWNYVREQVLCLGGLPGPAAAAAPVAVLGDAEFSALVAAQLALTVAAISRNPKSYPAWNHRRWLVENFHSGRGGSAGGGAPLIPLQGELALCAELLAKDERNFHCWNYRRWVVALECSAGSAASTEATLARELAFTDAKITQNFSNYSAWHARTCILQRMWEGRQDAAAVAAAAIAGEVQGAVAPKFHCSRRARARAPLPCHASASLTPPPMHSPSPPPPPLHRAGAGSQGSLHRA